MKDDFYGKKQPFRSPWWLIGAAVLLISLELDEVMNLSDRILVMYEGEIVGELDPKKTTVEELGLYMAGAKRGAEYGTKHE